MIRTYQYDDENRRLILGRLTYAFCPLKYLEKLTLVTQLNHSLSNISIFKIDFIFFFIFHYFMFKKSYYGSKKKLADPLPSS